MKAFWDFFASYPIKLDIRNKDVRFDKKVLKQQVSQSLPRSHEFLRVMFENRYYLEFGDIIVYKNGYIWISGQRLYNVFSDWLRNVGAQNKPTKRTFIQDLSRVGFDVKRRRFAGHVNQIRQIQLSPVEICDALCRKYHDLEILQEGLMTYCQRGTLPTLRGESGFLVTTEPQNENPAEQTPVV